MTDTQTPRDAISEAMLMRAHAAWIMELANLDDGGMQVIMTDAQAEIALKAAIQAALAHQAPVDSPVECEHCSREHTGECGPFCERCQGNGEIVTDWDRYIHLLNGDVGDEAVADCPDCDGTGYNSPHQAPGEVVASANPSEEVLASAITHLSERDWIIQSPSPGVFRALKDGSSAEHDAEGILSLASIFLWKRPPAQEDDHSSNPRNMVPTTEQGDLASRIEYILEADGVEGTVRRDHLTNHDLRSILTALRAANPERSTWRPDIVGPCPWSVGDRVMRKPGASYMFPGVIISIGLKLNGKTWHCEVECIAPGVEGCTHVFPANHLVALDPEWAGKADTIEALRKENAELQRVIGVAQGDLHMMKKAIKAGDPRPELLVRATDTDLILAKQSKRGAASDDTHHLRNVWG